MGSSLRILAGHKCHCQSQRLEQRSRMVTMLQILRVLTMPTRLMGTLMMISDFVSVCGVA